MIFSIIVSILTCLLIVLSSILLPNIKYKKCKINLYWIIALLGASLILIFNKLSFSEWWNSLVNKDGINPLQILILFLSMSAISIFLDEVGFFAHLASWVLKHVKKSQISLFIILYIFISLLTMFTSNDIIILTLTPFILFFCKNAQIDPKPYLVSEFIAANTWSMIFIIGNPTNIYLASSFNIGFLDYFKIMAIPTVFTGITEFVILFLLFRKSLFEDIKPVEVNLKPLNKIPTYIAAIILGICTLFLVISSYINLPMYLICASSFLILIISILIFALLKRQKPTELGKTFTRIPYELIPFIISMFTLVLSLEKYRITGEIAKFYGKNGSTFIYGFSSAFVANLTNNIPMSVFYSSICNFASESIKIRAIYSAIIGSNLGAFITPIGALAGIMWLSILKNHNIDYSYLDFLKYGVIVGIPALTVALSSLLLFI